MFKANNLGFAELLDSEETFDGFMRWVAQEGTAITGYYGLPYLNKHFGDAQFIERVVYNEEKESLEIVGIDSHAAGNSIWNLKFIGMHLKMDGDDQMQFRGVFSGADNERGMVPIEVVNADVLPGLVEGDTVELQMIAFPEEISYYAKIEDYEKTLPEDDMGKTWGIAEGFVFPSGLLSNHRADKGSVDNTESDMYVLLQSTVKKLYVGELEFEEGKVNGYIRCIVDTNFGELEIVHTYDELDEESKKNLKEGAVIFGVFSLSGDAAINEYSEGIVKNEEHNLQLLRYTITEGDPIRLKPVLSEEVIYTSDNWEDDCKGIEAVISRFQYVRDNSDHKFFAHKAIIDETGDSADLAGDIGRLCLILACDDPDNYESILFLEQDESEKIKSIRISRDTDYKFTILSQKDKKITLEDIAEKADCFNSMVGRAVLHGFLDHGVSCEDILSIEADDQNDDLEQMIQAWPDGVELWADDYMERLFGYMFTKAIETEYTRHLHEGEVSTYHLVGYSPDACWAGEYDSPYGEKEYNKFKLALKYGKQFYKDFSFTHNKEQDDYREGLDKAIYWVRCIGKYCAIDYMTR